MPLPKEIIPTSMDTKHHTHNNNNSNTTINNNKSTKWSLGNLFRRKKKEELTDSSSEEDRKAGFNPVKRKIKPKPKRNSKLIGAFDHIVVSPSEKTRDIPQIIHPNPGDISNIGVSSTGSLDRRTRKDTRIRLSNKLYPNEQKTRSSEDDTHSFNSSSISQFRSDESLGGQSVSSSKRTRAARNERYLKRISRGEDSSAFVPMGELAHRWQTQPINYGPPSPILPPAHHHRQQHQMQPPPPAANMAEVRKHGSHPSLQSTSSWNSSSIMPSTNVVPQPQQRNPPWNNLLLNNNKYQIPTDNNTKRNSQSEDYINRRFTTTNDLNVVKGPPPPPPRDPQRRFAAAATNGHSESRPLSYAFDRNTVPVPNTSINSRCVSDERLWGNRNIMPLPQRPSSVQPVPIRQLKYSLFKTPITEPTQSTPNVSTSQEYKYITDAAPRSRRPIHVVENQLSATAPASKPLQSTQTDFTQKPQPQQPPVLRYNQNGLLSPMKSASSFWHRIDQAESSRRNEHQHTPSVSSPTSKPKIIENRKYTLLNDVRKTNELAPDDELDNIVTGSLFIQPMKNCVFRTMPTSNGIKYPETTASVLERIKSSSMPGYYSQANRQIQNVPVNKYEEYVAKNISQPTSPFVYNKSAGPPPLPPQRRTATNSATASKRNSFTEEEARRKSTNLEDAINELEAIYASLRLGDEDLLDRAERRDMPTSTKFKKMLALSPEHDFDEDDTNTGEPDVVLDDVVYRNFKRAKSIPKTSDIQPPFGIPIGPIPPSPNTDYLHVSPSNVTSKPMFIPRKCPDIVADDLAVRNLRKDAGTAHQQPPSSSSQQQDGRGKKMKATRTMSENIYNLIQRDAAKPSGGCLDDYSVLEKSLSKARSLKNINEDDDTSNLLLVLQRNSAKQSPTPSFKQSLSPSSRRTTPDSRTGGAVFNLPSTLSASPTSVPIVSANKTPIPLPRSNSHPPNDMKSGGGTSTSGNIEEMLNAIAREAKESSEKLSRDLIELQKEIKSKSCSRSNLAKMKMEDEIDDAAKAAQRCKDILSDVVAADINEQQANKLQPPASPRRLRKEQKMLAEINDVANAAKLCESVLETVCTRPSLNKMTAAKERRKPPTVEETSIATLLEKLEPESRKIGAIAERCMRQLSELGDLHTKIVAKNAKPSVSPSIFEQSLRATIGSNDPTDLVKREKAAAALFDKPPSAASSSSIIVSGGEKIDSQFRKLSVNEQIDKIMQECAEEAHKSESKNVSSEEELNIVLLPPNNGQIVTETKLTRLSSSLDEAPNKSSSDCLKSSSATPNCAHSSNLTSYNTQSSSDYIKSPSSEFHVPSEEIKTNSTTSNYAKSSSSSTPPMHSANTSPASPSPPLPLTLQTIGGDAGGTESQYNSSEELAMIFGIKSTTPPPLPINTNATTTTSNVVSAPIATGNNNDTITVDQNIDNASVIAADATTTTITEHEMNSNCILPSSPPPPYWDCRQISFDSLDTIMEVPQEDMCHMTDDLEDDSLNFTCNLTINCDDDHDDERSDEIVTGGFNSLTSIGESSPDSGNVSLNEYPLIKINHHSSDILSSLPIDGDKYPFVSQLKINSNDTIDENPNETILSTVEFEINYKNEVSIPISYPLNNVNNDDDSDSDSDSEHKNNSQFPIILPNDSESVLRSRTSNSPIPSTSNQLNRSHSIKETISQERPFFVENQHVLLACTLCLANNDLITLAAIFIAILTIIALFVL